jgi:hypothetical protein
VWLVSLSSGWSRSCYYSHKQREFAEHTEPCILIQHPYPISRHSSPSLPFRQRQPSSDAGTQSYGSEDGRKAPDGRVTEERKSQCVPISFLSSHLSGTRPTPGLRWALFASFHYALSLELIGFPTTTLEGPSRSCLKCAVPSFRHARQKYREIRAAQIFAQPCAPFPAHSSPGGGWWHISKNNGNSLAGFS